MSDTAKLAREFIRWYNSDRAINRDGDRIAFKVVPHLAALLDRVKEESEKRGWAAAIAGRDIDVSRVVRESCPEEHAREVFRRLNIGSHEGEP